MVSILGNIAQARSLWNEREMTERMRKLLSYLVFLIICEQENIIFHFHASIIYVLPESLIFLVSGSCWDNKFSNLIVHLMKMCFLYTRIRRNLTKS